MRIFIAKLTDSGTLTVLGSAIPTFRLTEHLVVRADIPYRKMRTRIFVCHYKAGDSRDGASGAFEVMLCAQEPLAIGLKTRPWSPFLLKRGHVGTVTQPRWIPHRRTFFHGTGPSLLSSALDGRLRLRQVPILYSSYLAAIITNKPPNACYYRSSLRLRLITPDIKLSSTLIFVSLQHHLATNTLSAKDG